MPGATTTMQTMIGCQEFLDVLGRSGLVRPDLLKQVAVTASAKGARPESTQEWAALLLKEGFLTKFHLHHLFKKKWRGFFLHGKYKLLELIGSGGMGKVFVAEHLLLKQHVAVKVLPLGQDQAPGMVERFYREALASISLNHPNIVRAFDVDRSGGMHYLVMEFVDGRDLEEVVSQHGYFSVERACDYARQAALGLQHAHEAGWVHRDVKPGNLLVDRNGVVKLLDLGLARTLAARGKDNLTMNHMAAGAVLGTTNYLSPEQSLSSEVDIRADVYSLGATLYFMLSGRPPFAEGSITQKLIWLQTMEPESIVSLRPDVPHGLELVVRKMMAKKPDHRYATPAEVAAALAPYCGRGGHIPSPKELGASRVAKLQLGLSDLALAMELSRTGSSPSSASSTAQASDPTRMLPPPGRSDAAPESTPRPGSFSSVDENRLQPRAGSTVSDRSGYVPPSSAFGAALPPMSPAGAVPPPTSATGPNSVLAHAASAGMGARQLPPTSSISTAFQAGASSESNELLQEVFSQDDDVFDTASMQQTSGMKMLLAFGVPALVILAMVWQSGFFGSKSPNAAAPAAGATQLEPFVVTRDPAHPRFGTDRAFDTIAKAVSQAKPGDRIVLLDAEVQESLSLDGKTLPAGLTIEGDPSRPAPRWTTPIFKSDAAPALELQGAHGLTVRRIVFQGKGEAGPRVETLVRISGDSANLAFRDVQFESYKTCGLLLDSASGAAGRPLRVVGAVFRAGAAAGGRSDLRFAGDLCQHVEIQNALFQGPTDAACAFAGGTSDVRFENCRIHRAEAAFRLESTAGGKQFGLQVGSTTFADVTAVASFTAVSGLASDARAAFTNCLFYRTLRVERSEQDAGLESLFKAGEGNVRDDLSFGRQSALLPAGIATVDLELDPERPERFLCVHPASPLASAGPQGRPVGCRPE